MRYRVAQIYHHEQIDSKLLLYVYEEHANGVYLYVQLSAVKTLRIVRVLTLALP